MTDIYVILTKGVHIALYLTEVTKLVLNLF